ncbi:MAG: hypothetical protein AAGF97_13755, partial [Planctomycetota bacterium]
MLSDELPPNFLKDALRQELGLTWAASPLRPGLARIAEHADVSIFLDRRCDPGQRVTLELEAGTLADALRQIVAPLQLGVGSVGPVIYVGPSRAAATIATVTALRQQQARSLPKKLRERVLRRRAMSWPALSEPRWLIQRMVAEIGLELENPELIPHDLWEATKLPPLNWVERMTLVLAGFRLTFDLDPDSGLVRLRTYPSRTSIANTYPPPRQTKIVDALTEEFPQAFISLKEGQLSVRSTVEDHWQIAERLGAGGKPKKPASSSQATKAYSLRIQEQPLGPLLQQLADRLNLELDFTDGLEEPLAQRVTFEVTKVSAEELVQAA